MLMQDSQFREILMLKSTLLLAIMKSSSLHIGSQESMTMILLSSDSKELNSEDNILVDSQTKSLNR